MGIDIKDKVALVTGANRGIGRAIVETFLQHGARKVYAAVRDPGSARPLTEAFGDKVVVLRFDATDNASIQELAKAAPDTQILVNNAGALETDTALDDASEDNLKKEFEINVLGLIRVARAFRTILETNKGALVQLNSVASMKSFPGVATYSASKAASYSITQDLRQELGRNGVSVVSVHPGPIDTDMAVKAGFDFGSPPSAVSESIVAALANGDFHLFPDDFAKQIGTAFHSYAQDVILTDVAE